MDLGLKGKTALIAAASKGLGKATALELSKEGAHAAIAARGRGALPDAGEEICRVTGGKVLTVVVDVGSPEEIRALVETARKELGPIDILVVNAGGARSGQFEEIPDEDWASALRLNLLSAIRMIQLDGGHSRGLM